MTPPLLRVKQGTLTVDWCDFNGGPGQAIQVPADTGHVNLVVTNCDLGSDLLDSLENVVTNTPPTSPVIFISAKNAPAPHRVDATIQNNRISERTDNSGGKSISYGSSNALTISGNTYKATSGTPQVTVFEDYPTLIGGPGANGIAPRLAFGTNGVVTTHTTLAGGSGSHGIAPRLAFGANALIKNRQLLDGGTLGIGPQLSFGTNARILPGPVVLAGGSGAHGIAPRLAFGTNARIALLLRVLSAVHAAGSAGGSALSFLLKLPTVQAAGNAGGRVLGLLHQLPAVVAHGSSSTQGQLQRDLGAAHAAGQGSASAADLQLRLALARAAGQATVAAQPLRVVLASVSSHGASTTAVTKLARHSPYVGSMTVTSRPSVTISVTTKTAT